RTRSATTATERAGWLSGRLEQIAGQAVDHVTFSVVKKMTARALGRGKFAPSRAGVRAEWVKPRLLGVLRARRVDSGRDTNHHANNN
ncbi:MAG TPA: hypothetical protein VFM52_09610, partial [Rhodanobacter sp.]|nr:hypothetical protein [Rhodanobacter sp.]